MASTSDNLLSRLSKKRSKKLSGGTPLDQTDYLTIRKSPHWLAITGYIQPLFREPFMYSSSLDLMDIQKRIKMFQSNIESPTKLQYVFQEEIKRFFIALRDSMKNMAGTELLNKISAVWKPVYSVSIPCVTALFVHFESKMPVHKIILSVFRDVILFKVRIRESLADARKEIRDSEFPDRGMIPREITHMLLILQMEIDFYPELQEMLILAMDDLYEPIWSPVTIMEERCDTPEFTEAI